MVQLLELTHSFMPLSCLLSFLSLFQDSLLSLRLDYTVRPTNVILFISGEQRRWEGGLMSAYSTASVQDICLPWTKFIRITPTYTYSALRGETLCSFHQGGPDRFMNIDRVWLAEHWVSCRVAVFRLPTCLNVLNTPHYKDGVKQQSPSAGGSALLPTRHLAQVLLVPTGRHLTKARANIHSPSYALPLSEAYIMN